MESLATVARRVLAGIERRREDFRESPVAAADVRDNDGEVTTPQVVAAKSASTAGGDIAVEARDAQRGGNGARIAGPGTQRDINFKFAAVGVARGGAYKRPLPEWHRLDLLRAV